MLDILQPAALFATPLLVAATGELAVERAGVVNIGIEGMMLAGALAAWVANGYAGAGWGFVAAALAAGGVAGLFIVPAIGLGAGQVVTRGRINLLGFGATAPIYNRPS